MAKSITVLRGDMADALEKCSTNKTEIIQKRATDMRKEVQSDWVKCWDDVDRKYTDMVQRLQTELADRDGERVCGFVQKGDHHRCNVNGRPAR